MCYSPKGRKCRENTIIIDLKNVEFFVWNSKWTNWSTMGNGGSQKIVFEKHFLIFEINNTN